MTMYINPHKKKKMNYSIDKNIHTHTDKEIKSSSLFVHNIWNESIIGMKKKRRFDEANKKYI